MESLFFIMQDGYNEIFQLRLRDSFYCISTAHSLEEILENLSAIVKKYKTRKTLLKKLKASSDRGNISKVEFDRITPLFEIWEEVYSIEISQTVEEALAGITNTPSPANRILSLLKKKKPNIEVEQIFAQEVEQEVLIKKRNLPRIKKVLLT